MSEESQRRVERPIDKYPRVRDYGAMIFYSGLIPAAVGLVFVWEAHTGPTPGLDALFAYLNGAVSMMMAMAYLNDDA